MDDKEVIESSRKKQIRQPPSVPFLWEVKPGIANKDWRPMVSSVNPALPPPVKLVASVPFNWEEKPGKPLYCFSESPKESALLTPQANPIPLPLPPTYSQWDDNHKRDNDDGSRVNFCDKQEDMFNLDFESFSFETDDSLSSKPTLLANCLVSSVAISTAVPVQKISSNDINAQFETSSSPDSETDSSTSSYATGNSSLEGASFLECLFPLYSPKSGFLGKVARPKEESLTPPKLNSRDFVHENNSSVVVRRPPTLGELIMMSQKRSCQRRAAQMRKQNLSMVNL